MRRLLAVFVVTSTADVVDQSDGVTSLREAITAANASAGADQVTFDPAVFAGSTEIDLALGQLEVIDSLTISGPQQHALRIDAQGNSRVINFSSAFGDLTLESLTITGGRTVDDDINTRESGGAIRFGSSGMLTLNDVSVTDSRTLGAGARGGGIFAGSGNVMLYRSSITGNSTAGAGAHGGGIYVGSGYVSAFFSVVSGNTTTQNGSRGGAIYATGHVSIAASSLTVNRTLGDRADGGAIYSLAGVLIEDSVVSGNVTTGLDSDGGAIFTTGSFAARRSDVSFNRTEGRYAGGGAIAVDDANVTIRDSSITNNETQGEPAFGGGLLAVRSDVTITGSNISNNATMGTRSNGGGIAAFFTPVSVGSSTITLNTTNGSGGGISFTETNGETLQIENSIVAGNLAAGSPDFQSPDSTELVSVRSSLIGNNDGTGLDEAHTPSADGNLIGDASGDGIIDPQLAPLHLAGLTRVHPLQADSPAVDRGDASLLSTSRYDQRGAPFARVAGSHVDIGSYERQAIDPALLTVTNKFDGIDFSDSSVSLREAITVANGLPGRDVIQFDSVSFTSPNTIYLGGGQLVVSDSVSIEGPGHRQLSIDAMGNSRIMTAIGANTEVTLSGLTLTDGVTTVAEQRGGAIEFLSGATLTLRDVEVSGNRTIGDRSGGGAIYSRSGRVVLERSIVQGNSTAGVDAGGGAVHSGGGLVMVDTTVTDNSTYGASASGGGLHVHKASGTALEMQRSTVSDNSATGPGANGGGIVVGQGAIDLFNSTVSHNTAAADGGGIDLRGNLVVGNHRVASSTIAMNVSGGVGGGINVQSENRLPLTIHNSIVASNSDLGTNPDLNVSAPEGDLLIEASLIGDNSGTSLSESQAADAQGNLVGSATGGGVIDPMLGRLAGRGGLTSSHALLDGSPAIDAGDTLLLGQADTDQRGGPFARISGGGLDMGSFEAQSLGRGEAFVVNTVSDELDFSNEQLSLREALTLADGSVGHDYIRFDPDVFSAPEVIDLRHGELRFEDSVTIDGPGKDQLIVGTGEQFRIFNIESNDSEVTIRGMLITGGETGGDNEELDGVLETTHSGGGIRFVGSGSLTLDGVKLQNSRTKGVAALGGGIFASGPQVTLIDTTLTFNYTEGDQSRGGGLYVSNSDQVSIIDSTISDNWTEGVGAGGGAISASQATVMIEGSRVFSNETEGADSAGGAIESRDGDLSLYQTRVAGNDTQLANSPGAGLSFRDGRLRFVGSTLSNNKTRSADSPGAGMAVAQASVLVSHSTVAGNDTSADAVDGGGIYLDNSTAAIINSTLSDNEASGDESAGGAIFSRESAISIVNSTITFNSATESGGGIHVEPGANESVSIANSIIALNYDHALLGHDLAYPSNATDLVVRSSLISDNTGTTLDEAQTADVLGNLIGSRSGAGVINPMLSPLATNGGSVETRKPLAGSPVIDSGNDSLAVDIDSNPLTSDGRGAPFSRFNGTVDMGAFESQPAREPIIDWPDPANIFVGTQLSDLQLNATTNTDGTFTYTPDDGHELSVGDGQTLMVQFTPFDTVHYLSTTASVTIDVVEEADRGDAPDSYATLRASDGPSHIAGSLRLGSLIDADVDGQPSDDAGADTGDDGVSLISSLVADPSNPTTAAINVNASSSGMLDAWIDFNGNGVFDHPSEHLGGGTSIKLASQDNIVPITIPAGVTPGPTHARFRFSSAGGLLPTGSAADGEVEDHVFNILDGSASQIIDLDLPNGPARLFFDAGELVIQRRDVDLFRAPASAVDRFEIVGHEFSNVLTIDTTGGAAVPAGGLFFDGVDRVNTVRLVGPDNSLDLSRDGNVSLRNIDVIDISDPADSSLSLDARAVRAMDPNGSGVIVVGSPLDEIVFVDGPDWRMADPVDVAGFTFSFVTLADTFVQLDFGSLWRNRAQTEDVNNDGNVTAGDALRIINELVRREFSDRDTTQLNDLSDTMPWPNHYYDVSGDRQATALDALRVINYLARKSNVPGSGEGELAQASLDGMSARITLPTTVSGIDAFDVPTPFGSAQRSGEAAPTAAVDSVDRDGISERPEGAGDISGSAQLDEGRSAPSPFAALDQLWTDPFFVDELRLLERF
jgi:CSLREA domain-containing protein